MTIAEIQEEIVGEFSIFDDWMDKYEHIIESGKELDSISDDLKTSANLVKGCQSQVWLHAEMEGDNLIFQACSDAIITKGLVSLVVRTLSGHTPKEILDAELSFVDEIGLKEHLSPTRSNGLVSMIKKIKLYALAFQTKLNG
ncbi:MAG: SufE family protein [Flavobacteriales bacterium]|jgi:cysteine desulfuration protein SufE|nr:SufE family protein [Flavobacteriales bacterium]